MEIYQLKAFVTVARLSNLTRSAEALHLTQPAVTAQIKALEDELGVTLFDRKPGKIALSRTGEWLLDDAERLLSAASSLSARARALKGDLKGSFVIGTVGDPDSLRLGSLLRSLVDTLPLVDIKTRQGQSEELRELVEASSLQAAFYLGPHVPRDVLGVRLQAVPYRVAGPASLRQPMLEAGWRELAAMPWIGAPARHHVQLLLKDMFARQGLSPRFCMEADEASARHSLVRAGVGLTLLREDVALAAAGHDELAVWPHARVQALLHFIYPRSAEHDPVTTAAVSQLRDVWGLGAPRPPGPTTPSAS